MRHSFRVISFLAILTPIIMTRPVAAQSVEEFYKGKTVHIVVGYAAGGGHDSNARLLARYIGQYIPGKPRVVVENMPGAGSLKAVQYLDNGAPTDGTVFTAFSPGLVTESLTKPDHVPVNLNNYSWIGNIAQEIRTCYVRADLGIKNFQDLLNHPSITVGETGAGSAGYIDAGILKEIFGVKVKPIFGYTGSAEKRIAIERGELDGDCVSFSSIPKQWIEGGKIKILSRGSTVAAPGMPADVPFIMDLTDDPAKKNLIKFLSSPSIVGRPYIASRAVPADRVAALRAAFTAALKDPQLVADADKLQLPVIGSMTGEEAAAYIKDISGASPEVIAAARKITN